MGAVENDPPDVCLPDLQEPVAAIDDALVLKVLQSIWKKKTKTASRVRGRIELSLDWARVIKHLIGDNPARWRRHLAQALACIAHRHHIAFPIDKTPGFIQALQREVTGSLVPSNSAFPPPRARTKQWHASFGR
jgi:hypothetical protein